MREMREVATEDPRGAGVELLVTIKEAALRLGVSQTTVRRMLEAGQLRECRIRGRRNVRVDSILSLLDGNASPGDTPVRAGHDALKPMRGDGVCQSTETAMDSTSNRGRRTGTAATPMPAASELDALLAERSSAKRRRSSPDGGRGRRKSPAAECRQKDACSKT